MHTPTLRLLSKINLPRKLAHWALGEHHHPVVRLVAGAAIMVAGVLIAKVPMLCGWHHVAAHCGLDVIGYAVHGIGLTPYLEALIRQASEQVEDSIAQIEQSIGDR